MTGKIGKTSFFVLFSLVFIISCDKPTVEDLTAVITGGNYQETEKLLSKGAPVNNTADSQNNPLIIAAKNNNIAIMNLLLDYGADPNIEYENGSLLEWAIKTQDFALVKRLVEKGVDINYTNVKGYTVFSYAITYLQEENLPFFIDNGLNLLGESVLGNGPTPYFEILLFKKKIKTALAFLEYEEVVESVIHDLRTNYILVYYWTEGTKEVADKLVEKGFELDKDLPLIQYAKWNFEAVEWLLDHGMSPKKKYIEPDGNDIINSTPLEFAHYLEYSYLYGIISEPLYKEGDPEIIELRKVIKLLEDRISEME
jgi:hypothetical protein